MVGANWGREQESQTGPHKVVNTHNRSQYV